MLAWPPCAPSRLLYAERAKLANHSRHDLSFLSRERLGLLLGFVGMAIFGGTLPATRIAVAAIDPIALTSLRTAIAGLCSLALLLVLRRPLPPRALWPQLVDRDALRRHPVSVPDGARGADRRRLAWRRGAGNSADRHRAGRRRHHP